MADRISVLMTTYQGEQAFRLARSLESIFGQSVTADELVLVLDGPVDADQLAVVKTFTADPRMPLKVIALPQNVGLGAALAVGQDECAGEWIMRMDSDDVSLPERTQLQLAYVREHPDVDLVGAWSEEFFEDAPETRVKAAPIQADQVVRALRWRNVIVHPSVMLRASTMRKVGGFRGRFPYLEDWDLFIRLALAHGHFAVLPKVLIRVCASREQAGRRGGWKYLRSDLRFRIFCWRSGFLRFHEFLVVAVGFTGYRLAGPRIRGYLYRFVRKAHKA